jgi:putative nucleotidyltransferase with HDIG domain
MATNRAKEDWALQAKRLRQVIPEIGDIGDESLRTKVEQVWHMAWEGSDFDVDEAPNFPSRGYPAPGHSHPEMIRYTLVDHTRLVVLLARDIAQRLEEVYSIKVNRDELLAAAIIHDVDKMVVHTRQADEILTSETGKRIPHGVLSAKWAMEAGLPLDVVHAVISHSGRSSMFPRTLEALLVLYADLIAADTLRMKHGAKGILETYKHFGPQHSTHP